MIIATVSPNEGEDAVMCSVCGVRHKLLIDVEEDGEVKLVIGLKCIDKLAETIRNYRVKT